MLTNIKITKFNRPDYVKFDYYKAKSLLLYFHSLEKPNYHISVEKE